MLRGSTPRRRSGHRRSPTARSRLRRLGLPIVWLTMGVAMLLATVQDSNARLRPYYVLRSAAGESQIKPRILFVLDTSGSMSMRAQAALEECEWDECENPAFAGTDRESRLAAARRAVNEVILATEDNAKFALMTFLQNGAHGNSVPTMCNNDSGDPRRFVWVEDYNFDFPGFPSHEIQRDGHVGAWRLCQGNDVRPYPYLRWDDLGVGSAVAANDMAGDPPASPLISTNYGDISSDANAQRRVQWFPEFMGVRFQPNDTTDPTHDITYSTTGDYGTGAATQDTEVFGHDFYYWPYVDGFPGYAFYETHPTYGGANTGGIAGTDNNVHSGKLYSPFYFDFTGIPINPNAVGPSSEEEAREAVLAHTSSMVNGGVDAAGYTPWRSTIGPIPNAPTQSNAIYAHSTVSSYLAFVNNIESPDVCAPTAAVLITDGAPFPNTEGGWRLYQRLAALRNELGAQVYVLGFFIASDVELNAMACASAGACDGVWCTTPCNDAPADDWDTCFNPDDPENECAYQATSAEELQQALSTIVGEVGDFDLPSGPGSTANEFGVASGGDEIDALQTTVSAITDYPSWQGHVVREACDFRDGDGALLPACEPTGFDPEDLEETFGECEMSRTWDAGQCLADNPWQGRQIYTHDSNNELVRVVENDGSGTATAGFVAELVSQNLVSGDVQAEANEIAAFLLGRDAPSNWRLPGLANSAPIIVRRIPPHDPGSTPSVAIRDPHCGGRLLGAADGVPATLEEYAAEVWDDSDPTAYEEAQEAVIIGDDFGVLHAFQFNSGNELWGFIPRFALESLAEKASVGAATYGQTGEVEDHNYGLAATINRGWVYDDSDPDASQHRWRLLAIMGMGAGGREHMVLDLSHMSPDSSRGPFEILWTTEDEDGVPGGIKERYDGFNGETWARPALGYHIPGETSTQIPEAYFIMGTGYPVDAGLEEGRTLLQVNALNGDIEDYAVLPPVDPDDTYEPSFGTVVDPAVGTHCLSRMWAEMQEVYIADPAGRLFRWDLGQETAHAADSGGLWNNAAQMALDTPIPACEGTGDSCTVNPANRAESFTFPPAVTSTDRLDDITSVTTAGPLSPSDQFLLALIGGSPADDALRGTIGEDYQSSIYLLVDDHSGDASGGFQVPAGAPKALPGANANYMRMALTDIERERRIVPYAGADEVVEVRNFSRDTRPMRAPRIFVTGVVDNNTGDIIDGVEVYFIEYTVYEPPSAICDPNFYDDDNEAWHDDPGSTYTITLRLTANVASGFDLINGAGAGSPADFEDGFEEGLTLESVAQIGSGECEGDGCGPQLGNPAPAPCNNNAGGGTSNTSSRSALTISHSQLSGFTPVE